MNQLLIVARLQELAALRHTPAGLPALDLVLMHESEQEEAEQTRQVRLELRAQAFGTLAEGLARQGLGSEWRFSGFLAPNRGGKQAVFHIQSYQQVNHL